MRWEAQVPFFVSSAMLLCRRLFRPVLADADTKRLCGGIHHCSPAFMAVFNYQGSSLPSSLLLLLSAASQA